VVPGTEGLGEFVIRADTETPSELLEEYIPYRLVGPGLVGVGVY